MAIVYRAQDETLKREVAIKVLHQHLAAEPESKARLEREAQAVAKLRHENILEIFDYSGSGSQSSYIVTEFIAGRTLKQFLAERPLAHAEVAALIATEIGGALAHAHGLGIIHRDIKPENVMIRNDGLLKLMDFGIAQVVDLQRMTVTGQLLGSPAYMAPELVEGKLLDFRTDVFSIGIMLYQLATGSLPFTGKNPHEVLRRITDGKFPDPRTLNRRVSDALARIIGRALARRPEDRYPEVGQLCDDLRDHLGEAGIVDVRGELRAFFADPAAYEAALPARMSAALVGAAERQLADGKGTKAMELWNRVLAFEPQHPVVLAALRRLEGRNRIKAAAVAVAVAAALGGTAWTIARLRPVRHEIAGQPQVTVSVAPAAPPAPPVVTRSFPPPVPAAAPVVAAHVTAPPRARPARSVPPARVAPAVPAAAPAATKTFTLGPTPQNVDVYLDGERQFAYDTDHKTLTVPWNGNHVIEFKSPAGCCFVERVELGPDRPLPPDGVVARRLKWRPAHLRVTLDPETAGARVMVRDPARPGAATAARAGEEVDVPFAAADDPNKEVEIVVESGDAVTTDRLTVRPGQRLTHTVKLKADGN
jgi:serine/threonine-protein kinase